MSFCRISSCDNDDGDAYVLKGYWDEKRENLEESGKVGRLRPDMAMRRFRMAWQDHAWACEVAAWPCGYRELGGLVQKPWGCRARGGHSHASVSSRNQIYK
ncbi:hypothetical protein L1987_48640 [Smallanthus sonchifolius]|uniref:Uncharacterized protein n=1 Tax=Smallanthus sonchifolius TaxID=185202 RepID=A0ACB9FSJ5_9ASTR|nr:hypothetical protein L1987_48640 [Smallanthus sonchifolius]